MTTNWESEAKPLTKEEFLESLRKGFELLKERSGEIRPHRVYFRGGIFECSDPRLQYMIENNIMNVRDLPELQ